MKTKIKSDQMELKYHRILFVQINDIYHIDTSADYSDDSSLILPRIATLIKRLRNKYGKDRVFFCLPGDFLGPSCLSKQFKGKQMVSVLNSMGLDFATFGNHEFEDEFTVKDVVARIKESHFKWVSSNFAFIDESKIKDRLGLHERLIDKGYIITDTDIRLSENNFIVLLGLMYQDSFKGFGRTFDPVLLSKQIIAKWKKQLADTQQTMDDKKYGLTFIALTHQSLEEDIDLAKNCPEIRLIMGGHDHDVIKQNTDTQTLIAKTASNARTLRLNFVVSIAREQIDSLEKIFGDLNAATSYVSDYLWNELLKDLYSVMLTWSEKPLPADIPSFNEALYNFANKDMFGLADDIRVGQLLSGGDCVFVFSVALDTTNKNFTKIIPEDGKVRRRIDYWLNKSCETTDTIIQSPYELIVEDRRVRRGSTNFGNLIADIVRGVPPLGTFTEPASIGIINSGSFRLNRNIQKGESISKKTVCDVFFHRNSVKEFNLTGAELMALLNKSLNLVKCSQEGHGDFLQISGIQIKVENWRISEVSIVTLKGDTQILEQEKNYTVATTDYVAYRSVQYKEWFENKEKTRIIADDIKTAVEATLTNLQEQEELSLQGKQKGHNLFATYLALNGEPRWKFN